MSIIFALTVIARQAVLYENYWLFCLYFRTVLEMQTSELSSVLTIIMSPSRENTTNGCHTTEVCMLVYMSLYVICIS